MSDWRLNGQEECLSNIILYKVTFPEFWDTAYRNKHTFYQKIARFAEQFVAETNRGAEYLEGDKIQHFWHEHCEFCWEKALTDKNCEFYYGSSQHLYCVFLPIERGQNRWHLVLLYYKKRSSLPT